ncbi:AAA family ATPase, partial [bacterium]|nr:AAA family ATPase [bacterium]
KMEIDKFKVSLQDLRWHPDLAGFNFGADNKLEPVSETIGQKRAIKALKMGTQIRSPGFNVFVTGLVGTGRKSTIRKILEEIKPKCINLFDFCFVNNFTDPDRPELIKLPAGKGKQFKKDMADLILDLQKKLTKLFESDNYFEEQKNISKKYAEREKELITQFENKAKADGFAIVQVQMGSYMRPDIYPLFEDKPIPMEKFEEEVQAGKLQMGNLEEFKSKYEGYRTELVHVLKESRKLAKEMTDKLKDHERDVASYVIEQEIEEICEKHKDEKINQYLGKVKGRIYEVIDLFKKDEQSERSQDKNLPAFLMPGAAKDSDKFKEFEVNIILDNSENKTCPVVVETSPTFVNLFGTIEHSYEQPGVFKTDFTQIKSGSLLRANGGYLVLSATDVFSEPGVWVTLKRCLKYNKLEIAPPESIYRLNTTALKPEPVDIDVKVIMIGDFKVYDILYNYEEDLQKIFKVRADFDSEMDLADSNVKEYCGIIYKVCKEENLLFPDPEALQRIIEEGVRMAGKKGKITTKFGEIADIVRESHYYANQKKAKSINKKHVEAAIEAKRDRNSLFEDKIQERINEGTIMISTEGTRVGQINGLAVYSIGDYMFGKPTRITASTSTGKAGIINIEREAKLSGKTHDKGVLIISGFLRERYAQDKPLNLSASICFEQSYSGIDGDSASSTEIYALISSLSGIGIKQNIAVTGSVNQKGDIQPIGGVNQKIEGFFDVCKVKGLNGEHGVIIPKQNVPDLMLREDIVKAVERNKFRIFAVATIDEGLEILTGYEVGKRDKTGKYPKGTLNFLVEKKLQDISKALKEEDSEDKKKPGTKKKKSKPKK